MDEENVVDMLGKGVNLAHLNVRSLMGGHKFEMVRNEIESSNADVFSVSESWLSKAIPDRVVEYMNYNVIRLDRNWSEVGEKAIYPKRGGGLACYIKSNVKYSDTKFEALNKSCKDLGMLWVSLEIDHMRPLVLVTVYRPPQGDHKLCNEMINKAFI